jgi:hypothetical protein
MGEARKSMVASVSRRLLNHADKIGADPNLIVLWYPLV